jgi:hypothetical protein
LTRYERYRLSISATLSLLVVALAAVFVTMSFGVAADLEGGVEAEHLRFLKDDQCFICHLDEDYLPEGFLLEDAHMQAGLSCSGCHGGDPTSDDEDVSMSVAAGFVGAPSRAEMTEFCGRCHSSIEFMRQFQPRIATDQVSQYYTSVHGIKLREGDGKVADCTSCHSAHGILPASDGRSSVYALNVPATCQKCHGDADYMAEYNIATNQYEKYDKNVHGVALLENQDAGSPACNDCHGNHGATPPGVGSLSQVCGECHVNNMQYFQASAMAKPFEEHDLVACEACHGNHEVQRTYDDMVGIGDDSVCLDCHEKGDVGYAVADTIRLHLAGLTTIYDAAVVRQEEVQHKGMDDVEIEFLLQEAHQSLIQARTLVHTFDPQKVGLKIAEGVQKADEALVLGQESIKDHFIRRRGLGFATLFITLLVVALILKISQLDH